MTTEYTFSDVDERHPTRAAINRALARVAACSARPQLWYERWRQLAACSAAEERVAVLQAIRGSGWLSMEACFYLLVILRFKTSHQVALQNQPAS